LGHPKVSTASPYVFEISYKLLKADVGAFLKFCLFLMILTHLNDQCGIMWGIVVKRPNTSQPL
jgi:hypothetical protein